MPKRYHGEGRTRCTLHPYVTNRANPCLEGRAAPRLCMWDCTPFGPLRTTRGFPRAGELSTAWGNAVFLLEGGLGPSHYWGWACSMLGCTAQLHISPAATPLLAWDRCWVLPAGAVCSGCSHSILQSILLCANPTAWPCSCSGAAPCAPVSLYEHWGGGGNEPEGDAGSSCSWGSPSLVCLHRQCPMEHTGTGCGVPLVRSPTAPQHHAPIRPLALRSNIIFIGETGRG